MKLMLIVMYFLVAQPSPAGIGLSERARAVTDVEGMRQLVGAMYPDTASLSSFCEGVFEPPGFYFLNVPLKFGVLSGEAFVFQGTRDSLRLRAHLPARDWVWRRAAWVDGRLIISEQPYSGIDMSGPEAEVAWKPIIELLP